MPVSVADDYCIFKAKYKRSVKYLQDFQQNKNGKQHERVV